MSSTLSSAEDVPPFLVDRFDEHSPATLRTIAAFADRDARYDEVPEYVVQAFALQDDETKRAAAEYALALADAKDRSG